MMSLHYLNAPDHVERLRRSALLAAAGVGAIGLLAFAGWMFDLPLLHSVFAGHESMKANTALGMLLAGAALASCVQPSRHARMSGLLSVAVFALAVANLAQMQFGFDLGIDELWARDPVSVVAGRTPGRMAELTAAAFVIVGTIGVLSCMRVGARTRQALALMLLVVSLFTLGAYGYAMGTSVRGMPFSPIGINTAACLFLLALGWLASQPDIGVARVLASHRMGGELARRVMPIALLTPVLVSFLAQTAVVRGMLSVGATITWMAVVLSLFIAGLVWWGATQLDRLDRERENRRLLETSANTDELTGLANRRAFNEALATCLARHAQDGTVFCVILGDLDFFKHYNDSHGHLAGDEALRITGRLLRRALRADDLVARYGGEEFTMLLRGVDEAEALATAERICSEFRRAPWPLRPVTISIGVAQARTGESAQALLARVDAALYAAKSAGRDRAMRAAAADATSATPGVAPPAP